MKRLAGGRNNRVYRIEGSEEAVLKKVYFKDEWPRCDHEWMFSMFAWKQGIRCIPQPICCDATAAGYRYIEGESPSPEKLLQSHVAQAISFFVQLNMHRKEVEAQQLPIAKEACFSMKEHGDCIRERVFTLRKLMRGSSVEGWIEKNLLPQMDALLDNDEFLDITLLPQKQRCLSPSDFGFHNAIVMSDGKVMFHDFEYAGWDDPAKMVCDFFCQPQVPVPLELWDMFVNTVCNSFKGAKERAEKLLPLYRIKWCCILLSGLSDHGKQRRFFADVKETQSTQLKRCQHLLDGAKLRSV